MGRVFRAAFASSLMLAFAICAQAQQTPAQPDDEIVRLSPFTVQQSAEMGRYQAIEASSGSRIRMDLMDATQSISVVTNEFMQDVGTGRLLDAAKYVAGVAESNSPNGLDRMNVRGFMSIGGATIDGFNQFNWINQDPIIVDRIEVVKGPNSILAPQGLLGGVLNNITRKPLFKNKGYVSYQVGRWGANRAEFDANYVVRPDKLAVRVVGAVTDADDYGKDEFHQNITVMPMFTYRLSPTTEFTLQVQAYNASHTAHNNGSPISLYAVGRSNIHLQEGLPRDFLYAGRNSTRHQSGQNIRLFFTSQITDKLSMRLVSNLVEANVRVPYFYASKANIEVVKLDPITGEWGWDGVTLNDNPTYTLGGDKAWAKRNRANWQNDFVYEHTGSGWKSQTVAGYTIDYRSDLWTAKNFVADATQYDFRNNFTPIGYTVESDWRDHFSSRGRSNQVYVYEVIHLFDDRLVLSGSLSQNRYYANSRNNKTGKYSSDSGEATLPSGGVIYKVTPEVSLYYGFAKQELLGGTDESQGIPPHTIPSRQHEGGVRLRLFDGKLYATIAYFDILQENLYEPDFRNFSTPRPNPPYPSVLAERTAKGVEVEFTWAPTKTLSIIGSYTDFKNRDQDDMPYSNVAEKTAAIWGSYTFPETSPLRGLSVGIGANYVSERPGDADGRYTEPPPGYDPVRVQPMFWLPSYTLVEASANYRFNKSWSAQLHIRNLLDRDYIVGSFNRGVFVSVPINPKLTLRYDF